MAAPYTVKVEADFSGTAFGGSPTWTDITTYVLSTGVGQPISISRGKRDESSAASPGTLTLVLKNTDGRFTPGYASGAYYPHVTPGVRLRVSVTIGATTTQRFDGYTMDWECSLAGGTFSVTTVSCVDWSGMAGTRMVLDTILAEEIALDGPLALYQLQEPQGATQFGDALGKAKNVTVAQSKYGAGGSATAGIDMPNTSDALTGVTLSPTSPGSTSTVSPGTYLSVPLTASAYVGNTGFTFECLVTVNNPTLNAQIIMGLMTSDPAAPGIVCEVFASGGLLFAWSDGVAASTLTIPTDTLTHHVAVTLAADLNTRTIYVDGVAGASSSGTAVVFPNITDCSLGMVAIAWHGIYQSPAAITVAYAACYNKPLSAARIAAHATAAANAFAGETISAHFTRLLSYRPDTGSNVGTSVGTIGRQATAGESLQAALQDCGTAEQGAVYVDTQGRATLVARTGLLFNPAIAVTLDASLGDIAVDATWRMDPQDIINAVTVSRPVGADQTTSDATSQATYGIAETSLTAVVNTDAAAADIAAWLLANNRNPRVRTPNLTCDLWAIASRSQTKANAILALESGQRVKVTNTPAVVPATDVIVEGYTEEISVDGYKISLLTSPLPLPVMVADDATLGICDTTNVAGF